MDSQSVTNILNAALSSPITMIVTGGVSLEVFIEHFVVRFIKSVPLKVLACGIVHGLFGVLVAYVSHGDWITALVSFLASFAIAEMKHQSDWGSDAAAAAGVIPPVAKAALVLLAVMALCGTAHAIQPSDLVSNVAGLDQRQLDVTSGYSVEYGKLGEQGFGSSFIAFTTFAGNVDIRFGALAYKNDWGFSGEGFVLGPSTSLARLEKLLNKDNKFFDGMEKYWNSSFGVSCVPEKIESVDDLKGPWRTIFFTNVKLFSL